MVISAVWFPFHCAQRINTYGYVVNEKREGCGELGGGHVGEWGRDGRMGGVGHRPVVRCIVPTVMTDIAAILVHLILK